MKELLASLKLIKEHYRYFVKSECKRCGDTRMVEADTHRDQPNAAEEVKAIIAERLKTQYSLCLMCNWPGLEYSVHVLRHTDYRRLWGLAFVLMILAIIGTSG